MLEWVKELKRNVNWKTKLDHAEWEKWERMSGGKYIALRQHTVHHEIKPGQM